MGKRYLALSLLVTLCTALLLVSPLPAMASQIQPPAVGHSAPFTPDVLPPVINIFPDFLAATHIAGPEVTTDTFTIQNDGDVDLTWTLEEDNTSAVCDAPSDIPWVSTDPTGATSAPGGFYNVIVEYNSTGLTSGTYTGTFCIDSNDPATPFVAFPVTLTVVLPSAVTLDSLAATSAIPMVVIGGIMGIVLLVGAGVVLKRA